MSDDIYRDYTAYLQRTSRVGDLYRRLLLFPVLKRRLVGHACDVGCGIGDFLAYRANTTGIDVNPYNVDACKRRGLAAAVIVNGRYPFSEGVFDSALANHVIEHLADPAPLLLETHRVLKPGGIIVVGVPGRKGFAFDPDHKVYYDRPKLYGVLQRFSFVPQASFYLPLPFPLLSGLVRQFSLYVVARRV